MSLNGVEAGRMPDDSIERELAAQSISGVDSEYGPIAVDGISEASLDNYFVPGAYEIMPRIKKSASDDGGRYESERFRRPRYHRSVPEINLSGMNSEPSPDQLGIIT